MIQVRMVAAVAADDLKQVGVAAYAGRLAAENRRPAVPGLITGGHAYLLSDGSAEHLLTLRHSPACC